MSKDASSLGPDSLSQHSVSRSLQALGIRPSKGKGQNFLVDRTVAERIVDLIPTGANTRIVEIGPGLGALTEVIVTRFENVAGVELDPALANALRSQFPQTSLDVIEDDALEVPVQRLAPNCEDYVLVGNLPYSVGTAIVRRFLEERHHPSLLIVMLQREVAERMAASPPKMSLLSVATQLYADATLAFHVPSESFKPRPKVESTVVVIVPKPDVPIPAAEREAFFELVEAGFAQKRKTLANSISSTLGVPKSEVVSQIETAGLDPALRAERLALNDWIRLHELRRDS